jgi:hypothetical protein
VELAHRFDGVTARPESSSAPELTKQGDHCAQHPLFGMNARLHRRCRIPPARDEGGAVGQEHCPIRLDAGGTASPLPLDRGSKRTGDRSRL